MGWVVFAIATVVYVATIEPTVSLWDCGEYIATAYKIEIGHPPGAPLFLLIANLFSNLAMGDVTQVAYYVNLMSALCSSFTILFLFWTITHFAKKLATRRSGSEELTNSQNLMVLMSGAVGALAYTFSDSFWFSAGEGEVYAMSSFFTAVVFWAMLKWEDNFGKPRNNKWIVFIAFLVGLSMGVHMLNLLAIPALVFIYYFKVTKKVTPGAFIGMGVLSVALLGFIFGVFIPQVVNLSGKTELLFVNGLGLPFNSGTIFFFIVLIGLVAFALQYTAKRKKLLLNTIALSFTFMLIGFSLFGILVIRSIANTPIDQNNPEDAVGLYSYLKREQYGSSPILFGQQYNSKIKKLENGDPVYIKDEKAGKYVIKDPRIGEKKIYRDKDLRFFPRMHSNNQDIHIQRYMQWSGSSKDKLPTASQNMKYFWNYQFIHMYWRYFMWNFVGKQNDIQGHGNALHGNWISGIDFIDSARVGPEEGLPDYLIENKGRNKYYFLPLILGLIGLFFQLKYDDKNTWVLFLLFVFTGIAIMVYVNQHAPQPRERDYAYVGSFYAFAIWIGLGVYGLWDLISKKVDNPAVAYAVSLATLIAVPGVMAKENWDDHDRSGRYTALASGKNYLDSCEPNALIFTMGDNDTFPLWYLQEVEGYRTDVRVVNLSLLNTDWYITQLKRDAYDGKAIPGKMKFNDYKQGTRNFAVFQDRIKKRITVEQMNNFILSDKKETKAQLQNGMTIDYYPTKQIRIPVDSAKVVSNGTVEPEDYNKVLPYLDIDLNTNQLQKKEMVMLDILANNNWERPIHFAITISNQSRDFLFLDKYFQLQGMTYKLVPINKPAQGQGQKGFIANNKLYDNLMNTFKWADTSDEGLYLDESNRNMIMNYRNVFSRLAMNLTKSGQKEKAIEVLDRVCENTMNSNLPPNYYTIPIIEAYFTAGAKEKGTKLAMDIIDTYGKEYMYIESLPRGLKKSNARERGRAQQFVGITQRILQRYNPEALKEMQK